MAQEMEKRDEGKSVLQLERIYPFFEKKEPRGSF